MPEQLTQRRSTNLPPRSSVHRVVGPSPHLLPGWLFQPEPKICQLRESASLAAQGGRGRAALDSKRLLARQSLTPVAQGHRGRSCSLSRLRQ